MNDAQHAAYSAYLRALADALLLRDWEVQLKRDAPYNDDCYAAVWVMDTENHAIVRVSEDYWNGSAEDRREWLVHELCHLMLDRVDRLLRELSALFPENSATTLTKSLHEKEIEVATQRLARVLSPFMPLPPVLDRDDV